MLLSGKKYLELLDQKFKPILSAHKIGSNDLACPKFDPVSRNAVWDGLKQAVGFELASASSKDLITDLGVTFVADFLNGFKFVPSIERCTDEE